MEDFFGFGGGGQANFVGQEGFGGEGGAHWAMGAGGGLAGIGLQMQNFAQGAEQGGWGGGMLQGPMQQANQWDPGAGGLGRAAGNRAMRMNTPSGSPMDARQANYAGGRPGGGGMGGSGGRGGGGGGSSYNPYSGQASYSGTPQQQYSQYLNNLQQYNNMRSQQYNNQRQNVQAAYGSAAAGMLANQYKTQYDQAKAANESRYSQILQGYDSGKAQSMGYIDQMGKQQSADADMRYQQLGAQQQQSAVDRGLGNTTVTDALQRGVEQDHSAELRRINEGLLGQRLSSQSQWDRGKLGVMENRTDAYPDQNAMTGLFMQAGSAGLMPGASNQSIASYLNSAQKSFKM